MQPPEQFFQGRTRMLRLLCVRDGGINQSSTFPRAQTWAFVSRCRMPAQIGRHGDTDHSSHHERIDLRRRPIERSKDAYIGAHLLEVIFTSVGVFKYFRVVIGNCSSLPVISIFALSFQVAPSLNVTRRFKLHR